MTGGFPRPRVAPTSEASPVSQGRPAAKCREAEKAPRLPRQLPGISLRSQLAAQPWPPGGPTGGQQGGVRQASSPRGTLSPGLPLPCPPPGAGVQATHTRSVWCQVMPLASDKTGEGPGLTLDCVWLGILKALVWSEGLAGAVGASLSPSPATPTLHFPPAQTPPSAPPAPAQTPQL